MCATRDRRKREAGTGRVSASQKDARGVKVSQRGVKVSQRVATEAAGRTTRLRDSLISPGLRIHCPELQIHAHTACRVPLPLSPISDR